MIRALALIALLPAAAIAQSDIAAASRLFHKLEGRWSCSGGFPDGRKLAADLAFTSLQNGRLLGFTHADRPPSAYWQQATWVIDPKAGRVLDLSVSGSSPSPNVSPALFIASGWTESEITLVADTLKSPPWTPNRFRFTARDPTSLQMHWEINRNDTWILGDSLVCGR